MLEGDDTAYGYVAIRAAEAVSGGQVTHHSRTARGLADTGQVVRRTAPF